MIKIVSIISIAIFVGLSVSCTSLQPKTDQKGNKSIAFDRVDVKELDERICRENDFLTYLYGYNYWKTSEGYIFIISDGLQGAPGYEIKIKSVEEDESGKTIITMERSTPPEGQVLPAVMSFSRAIYRVDATNENFIVKTQEGKEFPRYSKNEFTMTGTVQGISFHHSKDPYLLKIIAEDKYSGLDDMDTRDFIGFHFYDNRSKAAKGLKPEDKVKVIYAIEANDKYYVKSAIKID